MDFASVADCDRYLERFDFGTMQGDFRRTRGVVLRQIK
jgi:hypothetical protein